MTDLAPMPSAAVAAVLEQPLLWLALTLLAYASGDWAARRSGSHPLVNPVLVAVALLGGALLLLGVRYETYATGGGLLTLFLPAATVALAPAMARHLPVARGCLGALLGGLLCGSIAGVAVTLGLARLLGASPLTLLSLASHSTTTAVSVEVTRAIGGAIPLAALATLLTGILGATLGAALLSRLGVRDPRAFGFALGTGSHALGTARAFAVSEAHGAFAALGLVANALLTAGALTAMCTVVGPTTP